VIVGFILVLQQTPLTVILAPPPTAIDPPLEAVVEEIFEIEVVVIEANEVKIC
jgi:hypothetical protein